jgi:MFS family permease
MQARLGLPQPIVPIFWGLLFLEATFGAYLSVWPLWIEHFGAPATVVGLVLGASGFIRILVLAPSAAIADRLGYRRAIVLCRLATAIGLMSAAFAVHWAQLIPMIIGGAIGELVFPLIQVLVASQSGEERMRSFALVFTVGPSIALIASPLISGALVALFGLRAAFVFGAACTLISVYFLAQIREPEQAVLHGQSPGSSYREAVKDSGVRLIAALLFASIFTLSLGAAFIPVFLEDVRGMEPAAISAMSAIAAVGTATFGLTFARLTRLQQVPFVAVAFAVGTTAIGFVLFGASAAIGLIAVGFFLRGGLFSAWATLSAALGDMAPAAHRARSFAFCEMAGGLAFALGPIVAGPLYSRRETLPFEAAIVLAIILVPILIASQRVAHRLKRASRAAIATAEGEAAAIA